MSQPHNKARYGETWDTEHLALCRGILEVIRTRVVLSGGWAWHFMSPEGHIELKHAHDHKDIDLFVPPHEVAEVVAFLKRAGFTPVWTKYDRLASKEDFRRYEKTSQLKGLKTRRVTIDFFVRGDVPFREVQSFKVVEPATLLTFYSNIHSSDKCFAVQAASRLLAQGIDPVGHPDLVAIPA